MSIEEQEQRLRQIQRQYVGFFDDGEADGTYEKAVTELIASKEKRLNVNINHLRKALPERAQNILEDAFDEIVAIQRALKEYIGTHSEKMNLWFNTKNNVNIHAVYISFVVWGCTCVYGDY